ncbi:Tethering factor for nuclear proteasome Cut8/Sts1 [Cinara cedri]|uniref:Tethering factor for nuclear proteasome Cut8/Sts1 n=1 Tax=Cinara cedri TaxID=506608 RepID=A0A5E4N8D2_9HEMI|nr:Tethering factor for nuclear proteasome Cut8/Sts1 [Cinara cedri]
MRFDQHYVPVFTKLQDMDEEETPYNPETTRLRTRNVLAEIPISHDRLSSSNLLNVIDHSDHYTNVMQSVQSNINCISLSTSPDELIIQQRGRKIRVVFSPDIDVTKQDSPTSKKTRMETMIVLPEDNCLCSALKTLTSDQLIGLIGQIVSDHPNVEKEIRINFPMADIKSLEGRICYLWHNIYKALSINRLVSKTNPIAYNRVSIHLLEFKKCVINQGRHLVESSQWSVVIDYVFMAWKYVRRTPIWDCPSHNAARKQCFKSLSEICMTALQHMKESLNQETCENYRNRLKLLANDHKEDIELCLRFLEI